MQVIPVTPFGYCSGVERALSLALKAKREHPKQNVYLLGMLIHNETALKELKSQGLFVLSEKDCLLEEALSSLKEGDVVVFSAHGHPSRFDETAKKKKLIVYDATCPFVKGNMGLGKKLNPLIYLGLRGHLESEAFLANCPRAYFYDVKSRQGNWQEASETPSVLAQTTLGGMEIEAAMQDIQARFPEAKLVKGRCLATAERQAAVLEASKKADATLILGSDASNNTLKLKEIAEKSGPVFLCLGLEETRKLDLSLFHSIALASGASTSKATFLEVKDYLERL